MGLKKKAAKGSKKRPKGEAPRSREGQKKEVSPEPKDPSSRKRRKSSDEGLFSEPEGPKDPSSRKRRKSGDEGLFSEPNEVYHEATCDVQDYSSAQVEEPKVDAPVDQTEVIRDIESRLAPRIEKAIEDYFDKHLYAELDRRFREVMECVRDGGSGSSEEVLLRMDAIEQTQKRILELHQAGAVETVCNKCGSAMPPDSTECPYCSREERPRRPFDRVQEDEYEEDDFVEEDGRDGFDGYERRGIREVDRRSNDEDEWEDDDDDDDFVDDDRDYSERRESGERRKEPSYEDGFMDNEEYFELDEEEDRYPAPRDPRYESNDPSQWADQGGYGDENWGEGYTGRRTDYQQEDYSTDSYYDPTPKANSQVYYDPTGRGGVNSAPPKEKVAPVNVCPECRGLLDYIDAYQAWYCRTCNGYLDPRSGEMAKVGGKQEEKKQRKQYDDSQKLEDFVSFIEYDPDTDIDPNRPQEEGAPKKKKKGLLGGIFGKK